MKRELIAGLLAAALHGCSAPDAGEGFYCQSDQDCLAGYQCSAALFTCEREEAAGSSCTAGVCRDRVTVGISAPIDTGPTEIGRSMKDGIEAYFAQINARGYDGLAEQRGIHGRLLSLIYRDDGLNPEKAKANVSEMVGGDSRLAFALIGNVGATTAKTALPISNQAQAIYFGGMTGSALLRRDPPDRYVFNYRPSYVQESAAQVDYLLNRHEPKIAAQNIAVFPQGYDAKPAGYMDSYGQGGFDGVHVALQGRGIEAKDIVYATYSQVQLSNVAEPAKLFLQWLAGRVGVGGDPGWGGLRPKGKDGMIHAAIIGVPTYEPMAALIVRLRQQLELVAAGKSPGAEYELTVEEVLELRRVKTLLFFSGSFVDSVSLANRLKSTDPRYCNGVMVSEVVPHHNSGAAIVAEYRDQLRAFNPNLQPDQVSLEGYLVARLFVEGLQLHGAAALTSDSFATTLESLNVDFGLGASPSDRLYFSKGRHQASNRVWGTRLSSACEIEPLESW